MKPIAPEACLESQAFLAGHVSPLEQPYSMQNDLRKVDYFYKKKYCIKGLFNSSKTPTLCKIMIEIRSRYQLCHVVDRVNDHAPLHHHTKS